MMWLFLLMTLLWKRGNRIQVPHLALSLREGVEEEEGRIKEDHHVVVVVVEGDVIYVFVTK